MPYGIPERRGWVDVEMQHKPDNTKSRAQYFDMLADAVKEYPSDIGEPYYPIPSSKNQELYEKYKQLAKQSGIHMLGRLANYRYFNMDQAILNALEYFENTLL